MSRAYKALLFLVLLTLTGASAAQLRQVAIVDLPGRPGFDSMAFANGYLLITHTSAGTLDVFNPATRRLAAQVSKLNRPRDIAVDEKAGKIYVANAGANNLVVISTKDWGVLDVIPLQHSPATLLLVPARQTLYISNWRDHSVTALSLVDNSTAVAEVGARPEHMTFDAQTGRVFVNIHDTAEIAVLDENHKQIARWKLRASQPTGMAFDPETRRLFVAVRYAVLALNADSGEELARIPAAAGVDRLWFDPAIKTVFAASATGIVHMINVDGKYVNEQELPVEVRGNSVAYDPEGGYLYVPGGREGRSKLLILKRVNGNEPGAMARKPRVRKPAVAPAAAETAQKKPPR
jgi:DNA-binding beta-propeller fold protein YncE